MLNFARGFWIGVICAAALATLPFALPFQFFQSVLQKIWEEEENAD